MQTPLHISKFNDKVRSMNSGSAKELKLTAAEARNLHHDIFAMLEELNTSRAESTTPQEVLQIAMDAGNNSL
jgi:hypothetical protein